jgi:Leu/Phe-tRNA-protein transferase
MSEEEEQDITWVTRSRQAIVFDDSSAVDKNSQKFKDMEEKYNERIKSICSDICLSIAETVKKKQVKDLLEQRCVCGECEKEED